MKKPEKDNILSIRFSKEDHELLQSRAAKAGMTLSAYVRACALHSEIKSVDFPVLTQHAVAVGDAVYAIRTACSSPHPDRWLYQADLERIEEKLDNLIIIETDIQNQLRRKLHHGGEHTWQL